MIEKELKKQSRAELLELLLIQTKESERLRAQLEKAQQQLADRQLRVHEAGNLANAVLAVNGVMEAAQAAAQQYLDNLAQMDADATKRGEQILENARIEAETILGQADRMKKEAEALKTEAEKYYLEAQKILQEAQKSRKKASAAPKPDISVPTTDDAMMEEFYRLLRD